MLLGQGLLRCNHTLALTLSYLFQARFFHEVEKAAPSISSLMLFLPYYLRYRKSLSLVPVKVLEKDFAGGPVAETLRSQCRGPGFHSWAGN